MKTLKKLLSSLLAVMLMAAMLTIPANAASGSHKIEISNADGHAFEAYQVFGGTLSGTVLSDIVWGDGVNGAVLLDALQTSEYFTTNFGNRFAVIPDNTEAEIAAAASAVALIMEDRANWDESDTQEFAKLVATTKDVLITEMKATATAADTGVCTIANLAPGYYFVKDVDAPSGDAYSRYMVQLTNKTTPVNIKKDVPTLNKYVSLVGGLGTEKAVSAGPGNTVYFTLTAKMHTRIADYGKFPLTFTDELPTGLINPKLESVYVNKTLLTDANPETNAVIEIGNETVTIAGTGTTSDPVIISVSDAKGIIKAGTNGADVVATDTISVVFSVTVDKAATPLVLGATGNVNKATMTFPNNPNPDGATSTATTAVTENTKAAVFTYQMKVNKKDASDGDPLEGAVFHIYFLDDLGVKKYVQADANYAVTSVTESHDQATDFTTGSNGSFTVKGLRERTYYLEESVAPANYNKIKVDQTVTIDASFSGLTLQTLTATPTGAYTSVKTTNVDTGMVEVDVLNTRGATLPETGGIGTTIFYIAGAALMIGAGAVLITKKRTQK